MGVGGREKKPWHNQQQCSVHNTVPKNRIFYYLCLANISVSKMASVFWAVKLK